MGRALGGIGEERRLIHEMRLMLMRSNGLVCWPGLLNARATPTLPIASACLLITGKLNWSCPLHSTGLVCWRSLVKSIATQMHSFASA